MSSSKTQAFGSVSIEREQVNLRFPSNKTLGIIAMICSPFLFVEMLADHKFGLRNTSAAGIADLIYMTGWICSIIGLIKQEATGSKKPGKRLLTLNLIFLGVACIWNIWTAIDPTNNSALYRVLDFFWPASNTLLFITGIVIAVQKKLTGFGRWTPLLAGFWLGFAIIFSMVAGGRNDLSFYTIGAYSTIAWFLLGLSIYKGEEV
ncbi:MAG: hypothetical protein EOO04_24500 [Chitinophagaceae bacterium]|nr:MAG: hypothetical protein EOO04_24500 [Chitinophagaceae bacterium]